MLDLSNRDRFLRASARRGCGAAAEVDNANISEAEYEVFSAYISQSFVGAVGKDRIDRQISQIVIVNRTESDKDDLDDFLDPNDPPPGGTVETYLQREAPSLRAITISNFHEPIKNRENLRLSFTCPCLISSCQQRRLGRS